MDFVNVLSQSRSSIDRTLIICERYRYVEVQDGLWNQAIILSTTLVLTWYALARLAGIPNANTVRDVEYESDAQLSTLQAVAKVLGLRLELVEETIWAR